MLGNTGRGVLLLYSSIESAMCVATAAAAAADRTRTTNDIAGGRAQFRRF